MGWVSPALVVAAAVSAGKCGLLSFFLGRVCYGSVLAAWDGICSERWGRWAYLLLADAILLVRGGRRLWPWQCGNLQVQWM